MGKCSARIYIDAHGIIREMSAQHIHADSVKDMNYEILQLLLFVAQAARKAYGLQASSNRRLNCFISVNVQTQANVFYRGVFVESCVMVENYVIMSFIASLKSIT